MGRVTTIITGDASQLTAEQRKVAESAKKMSEEFKDVDRSIRQMGREADKVFRETRTSQEKHNKEIEKLRSLLRAGKIDQDTFNRAVERTNDEFAQGNKQLGDLKSSLAGYIGTGLGLSTVLEIWRGIREEREAIAELEKAQFPSSGQLMQVSSDLADFQQLKAQAAGLLRSGAATSMSEAQEIMFALRSTGLERDRDVFADVARTQLVPNLAELINSVDSLKDAFGAGETGGAREIISKALAVSGLSQRPAQQIVASTARVGATAFARGLSDEETLAAIGVLADPFSSPERAAERLQAFLNATQRKGIEGANLQSLLDASQQRIADEGTSAIETLGDATAVAFFEAARANREQILQATRAAEEATQSDALAQKIRDLETAEAFNIESRATAGTLEAIKLRGSAGELGLLQQQIRETYESLLRSQGASEGRIGLGRFIRGLPIFGGDVYEPLPMEHLPLYRGLAQSDESRELLEELVRLQRRALEVAEEERTQQETLRQQDTRRRAPPTLIPRPETN